MQGEAFQNTSWINHFETQNIKIGGLNNELYEFKTVGRNDYPDDNDVNSRSESPASEVTDGRPIPLITSKYRAGGRGGIGESLGLGLGFRDPSFPCVHFPNKFEWSPCESFQSSSDPFFRVLSYD